MKLIVAVLMAVMPLTGVFGQINVVDNADLVAIDTVKYNVTYSAKVMNAAVALGQKTMNYPYIDDEVVIEIGNRCSHFYSIADVEKKKQMMDMASKGYVNMKELRKSAIEWHVYKNYPEGKVMYIEPQFGEYRVEESPEVPEWTIVGDSTANILGYNCTMATADYKGRKWKAYYTEDIPIDNGPWKLCGLPGLIMKAYDSENHYIFEAIGMKQMEDVQPITYDIGFDKYEKLSMKDLTDLRHKQTLESIGASLGIGMGEVVVTSRKSMPDEAQKRLKRTMPYNPIERCGQD